MRALFSGGGSGGHVFPGLAVAGVLAERGWKVDWAGSANGLEARLVAERGLPFHALPSRPVLGQGLVGKARAALTIGAAAVKGRQLVRRLDARVVVGTGGYASAPAVVGARLAARPALLIEPNAAPGIANRFLSRFAAGAAVAWEETAQQLRCPVWPTGVPVRRDFFAGDGELPQSASGGAPHVLVLGGSQGARQLNEILPSAFAGLGINGLRITHQTGTRHLDEARAAYATTDLDTNVVPFIDDMANAVQSAHLVVSRAGAITLAELCAAGRPSLLLPLRIAAGHQVDNARRMVNAGAAALWEDGDDLGEILHSLLSDRERLQAMAHAARTLARENAAADIADKVAEEVEKKVGGRDV